MNEAIAGTKSIAEVLQAYGGWGLSAVLIVILVVLFWYMNRKGEQKDAVVSALLEKRNDQFIAVLKECGSTMVLVCDLMKSTQEHLKENEEFLKRVDRVVDRCENAKK